MLLAVAPQIVGTIRLNIGALELAKVVLAEESERNERFSAATAHLRQVQPPTRYAGEVERLIGVALLLQHRQDEAIEQFELAQQFGSQYAKVNLGNLYLEQKQWRQAVTKLDESVCPDYQCIDRYVTKLLKENRRTDAIELLTTYINIYPTATGKPYYQLFGQYWGRESNEVLRDLLKKGLEADPQKDSAVYLYYSALLSSLEENDAEAIHILVEAVKVDPTYYPAFHFLGQLYLKTEEPQKAGDMFEKALQIDPMREWTHYYLASAYLQLNRPMDATDELWQALILTPRNEMFLDRLISVYQQSGMTCFEQQLLSLKQMTSTDNSLDVGKERSRITQQCH